MFSPADLGEKPKLKILVIDDTQEEYVWIGRALDRLPSTEVFHKWVDNPMEANDLHAEHNFDAVLMDYHLNGITAPEAFDLLNYGLKSIPFILMTSSGGIENNFRAMEKGASLFLHKSEIKPDLLERILLYSIRQKEQETRLTNFSSYLAHDISAPLRNISSFIKVLEDSFGEKMADDERSMMLEISEQTTRSQQMVRDLLDYTLTTRKELSTSQHVFGDVVSPIIDSLKDVIEDANAAITVEESETEIQCDASLTSHVLTNLIQNGIKYNDSDQPRITIKLTVQPSWYIISVADNGQGIEDKFAKKIFEPLFRIQFEDKSRLGTGLGLAISKEIVERQGGNIWVDSQIGEGSAFYLRLPRAKT